MSLLVRGMGAGGGGGEGFPASDKPGMSKETAEAIVSTFDSLTEAGKQIYLTQKEGQARIKAAKAALKKPVTTSTAAKSEWTKYWWLIPIGVVGVAGLVAFMAFRKKG